MKNNLKKTCIENVIQYWSFLAQKAGGFIIDNDMMTATIMGVNSGIFNAILKFDAKNYHQIKSQIAMQYKSTLPIGFWLDENTPDSDKKFLEALNLPTFGHIPVMVIKTDSIFSAPLSEEIKIIKYDKRDLTEWMEPFCIAFGFEPIVSNIIQQIFENNPDSFTHFAALYNQRVVACASIFNQGKFAGFYNLATMPEYRNKGIATALHLARLKYAKEQGFDYATLQATPMAAQLDAKLGFEKVGGFQIYMDSI